MTIEEQLRDLMIKKSGSVNKFAQECGLSQSTIFTIFQRGVAKANVNSIIKICQALKISTDELANGKITPLPENLNVLPDFWINYDKLSDKNKEQANSYIEFLLEMQRGKNDDKS